MKILLVDDNEHALNRLYLAVSEICASDEINKFNDPAEALEFSGKNIPDVAFLDIEMNGINGIVLAKALKEINPAVRFIFCTGYSEYALEAFKLHASGYLLKPVTGEDIKRELTALTEPVFVPFNKRVVFQTFGNFEVFVDGKVVNFSRVRSKEVLAVLVDNNGATVSTKHIIDLIFEDGTGDLNYQKQFYTLMSDIRRSFADLGVDDVIIKCAKGYAIDKTKVDCDYYRLLDGDLSVLNKYKGKYMYEYSWAEFSIGKIEEQISRSE